MSGKKMEGHEIACAQIYGAKDIKLKEEYVKQGARTARHQLVAAGYRLAALLNDLYGK
jgi:S1/P1 Nuclease